MILTYSRGKDACPTSEGVTFGGVIWFLFVSTLTLLALYLVLGMLYNYFALGLSGTEALPRFTLAGAGAKAGTDAAHPTRVLVGGERELLIVLVQLQLVSSNSNSMDSEAAPPAAMARIPPLHGRRHWDGASGALRCTVALYLDVYASTNSAARSPPRERDVKRTRPVSYAGPSSSSALSFIPYAHTHNHTAQLTPRARTGAAAPGV
ncbi:hypothetical protein B0H14DRAFT_2556660 [Mycena olivaceomarginata]|nr:hypothetical protein B0H14DRAFT_2556660 [Mycena olivaceomarginata]